MGMRVAQLCPVCIGKGKVPNPDYTNGTSALQTKTCHGCDGLGWVQVSS